MKQSNAVRLHKPLDSKAQDFRPGNRLSNNHITPFQTQFYYPYTLVYPLTYVPVPHAFDRWVNLDAVEPPIPPPLPPPPAAPTRALILSSVPTDVSKSRLRTDLEVFGNVRAVQMERSREGIVTVHFFDLRDAERAMVEIREQHMQQQSRLRRYHDATSFRHMGVKGNMFSAPTPPPAAGIIAGRAVWAQFTVPEISDVCDGNNMGTLVIFNLDSHICAAKIKEMFEPFGPIKEVREALSIDKRILVEFFDIRHAASAMSELNGKKINSREILIKFSQPGWHFRRTATTTTVAAAATTTASTSSATKNTPSSTIMDFYNISSKTILENTTCPSENSNNNIQKKASTNYQHKNRIRAWKGKKDMPSDHFFISGEDIVDSNIRDRRTTVMIKNIPNKYSQKLLLNLLDNHCLHCNEQIGEGSDQPLSSYDFVYLPIDFKNQCNMGYGFVNLTSSQATLRLYKAFHMQRWEVFNSRKICEVTYARLQGLEVLKEHFKNSRFACGPRDEYLPVMFSPPRDGKNSTEPIPIMGFFTAMVSKVKLISSQNEGEEIEDRIKDIDEPHGTESGDCNSNLRNLYNSAKILTVDRGSVMSTESGEKPQIL